MIRSLPLVRRTLLLSVCGLFLFSGRLFAGNPLLMPSEAPYGAPRFDRIHAADIMPAIEEGIRAYKAGIAKIRALDPAEATFENVVVPLDQQEDAFGVRAREPQPRQELARQRKARLRMAPEMPDALLVHGLAGGLAAVMQ